MFPLVWRCLILYAWTESELRLMFMSVGADLCLNSNGGGSMLCSFNLLCHPELILLCIMTLVPYVCATESTDGWALSALKQVWTGGTVATSAEWSFPFTLKVIWIYCSSSPPYNSPVSLLRDKTAPLQEFQGSKSEFTCCFHKYKMMLAHTPTHTYMRTQSSFKSVCVNKDHIVMMNLFNKKLMILCQQSLHCVKLSVKTLHTIISPFSLEHWHHV